MVHGIKNTHTAQVASPWSGHIPILRGGQSRGKFKRQLRDEIASGANYLVREVEVGYWPDILQPVKRHSHDELVDIISNTLVHIQILDGYGIRTADTEYRIVSDEEDVLRTLARVAVVDGQNFNRHNSHGLGKAALEHTAPSSAKKQLYDAREQYIHDYQSQIRLGDLKSDEQFKYGHERASGAIGEPQIYLIDPDAIIRGLTIIS